MAKKIPKPFVTRIQAEGTPQEKRLEQEEELKEARKLADQMPAEYHHRVIYVRNLTVKALRGEIDYNVFYKFLKMTNCWDIFYFTLERAKLIAKAERR